jgi:hypothetical protein
MSPLQAVKWWLVQHVDLAKDALHIYVALTLFLGSAALLRWPIRSWKPWALVLAAALIGEAWDLRDSMAYHDPIHLGGNIKDIWNTLFWPTVFLLLARYTSLFERRGDN